MSRPTIEIRTPPTGARMCFTCREPATIEIPSRGGLISVSFCGACLAVIAGFAPEDSHCICSPGFVAGGIIHADSCPVRPHADAAPMSEADRETATERAAFEALSAPWKAACALGVTEAVFIPREQTPAGRRASGYAPAADLEPLVDALFEAASSMGTLIGCGGDAEAARLQAKSAKLHLLAAIRSRS